MPMFVFDTANGRREVLPFISAAQVVTEWECPISKRKADVALLDDEGRAVLLVEVWHTHAVDLEKRMDLSPYWWIEVVREARCWRTQPHSVSKIMGIFRIRWRYLGSSLNCSVINSSCMPIGSG